MARTNRQLVVLIAAIAVAAVAIGGAFAYGQDPEAGDAAAAPLSGTPSTTASTTPSNTPTTPTATPSPTATKVKTTVNLAKLPQGRAPQVPYLVGRTVMGGAGGDVKIPGTEQIQAVARLGQDAMAIVSKGAGTELLKIENTGEVRRTPDVTQILTADDGNAAVYVASRTNENGEELAGATVYLETSEVQKISIPDRYGVMPLGYVDGKVYFSAQTTQDGSAWALYEWTPGAKPVAIKTVANPTGVTADGTMAASMSTLTDSSSCSNAIEVATGKRLWRTCDYQIHGFTPDGATAIAAPAYQDGYGDGVAAALDMTKGDLLHEWSGVFRQTVAEDDQHLLLLADDGEETPASIIRCTITTGACELATPLAKGELLIGT
ncbi:hypothetical protein EV646_10594 [Kribbella antiqua]|uniref:Pyrroloquinoline-quinone binding quinoprotein n=1 Tax=Kribbella antiqua TaxID=2512217 RepID=A0A4R2IQ91_9ACTN|nr:hypothetical protein [Kribbella antiqua]TCO47541.1 hypothetical protein EV646_10594 [Kribbella antiqua]